jgi:hypothetical protein
MTEKDRQYIQDKGINTIRQHAIDFVKTRNSAIESEK